MVKMEWLNSNVGSTQHPLKQTPEIIQSLRVYLAIHVLDGMIHNFMGESLAQLVIANSRIRVDLAAVFHVVQNLVLQGLAFYVRNDFSPHLPQTPVKYSEYSGLAKVGISAHLLPATLLQTILPAPVHLVRIRADESLIALNRAAVIAAKLESG